MEWLAVGIRSSEVYAVGDEPYCHWAILEIEKPREAIRILSEQDYMQDGPHRDYSTEVHYVEWTTKKEKFILDHRHFELQELTEAFNRIFLEKASMSSISIKRCRLLKKKTTWRDFK